MHYTSVGWYSVLEGRVWYQIRFRDTGNK